MAHHKHKTNRRSFTPRKLRLLRNLLSGRYASNYRAAIAAGYAPGATAKNAASRVLKEMRQNCPEVLDRLGLTNEALVKEYLIPALNADKIHLVQRDGKITDSVAVPDWRTRLTALDMTFQLLGAFDNGKDTQATPTAINFQVVNIAKKDTAKPDATNGPPNSAKMIDVAATSADRPAMPFDSESEPPTPPKKVPPRISYTRVEDLSPAVPPTVRRRA